MLIENLFSKKVGFDDFKKKLKKEFKEGNTFVAFLQQVNKTKISFMNIKIICRLFESENVSFEDQLKYIQAAADHSFVDKFLRFVFNR